MGRCKCGVDTGWGGGSLCQICKAKDIVKLKEKQDSCAHEWQVTNTGECHWNSEEKGISIYKVCSKCNLVEEIKSWVTN